MQPRVSVDELRLVETHRTRPHALVAEALDFPGGPPAAPSAPYVGVETAGVPGAEAGLTDLFASYDGRRVRLHAAGRVVRTKRVGLAPGSLLGFALCEAQATVLARDPESDAWADRWRPLLTERKRVRELVDPREPAWLVGQGWRPGSDEAPDGASDSRHGPFGMVGVRDPRLVTTEDGTPYSCDGLWFATWTCAGIGGFRQGHWGVFAFDPAIPWAQVKVAALFGRRGGKVYGDHAGHLVRSGDRWLVLVSSWGDFGPHRGTWVRHATSTADLLSGVHVLDTEATPLPVDAAVVSTWDPTVLRGPDGWLVAHVEATSLEPMRFRPALSRTSATVPWESLHRVAGLGEPGQTEGPVLLRDRTAVKVLASDGDRRRYPVFDTVNGVEVGRLDASYPTNIPHPQLLPPIEPDGPDGPDGPHDTGAWRMLTFDGTRLEPRWRESGRRPVTGYGTHGDLIVLEQQ